MKCLRCGYCCHQYTVMIVKDPTKGIREDNIICHEGKGVPCPHLKGNKPGSYRCAVHSRRWYRRTPCYDYGQIEESLDDPCRMGKYILDKAARK